jgi:hypothetical protein
VAESDSTITIGDGRYVNKWFPSASKTYQDRVMQNFIEWTSESIMRLESGHSVCNGRRTRQGLWWLLSAAAAFSVVTSEQVAHAQNAEAGPSAPPASPPETSVAPAEAADGSATGTAQAPGWLPEFRAAAGISNFGGSGSVGFRVEAPSGLALSLSGLGAYGTWYTNGFASDKATTVGGSALLEIPILNSGTRRFTLRTGLGARTTGAPDLAARSFVVTSEVGLRATVQATPDLELYVGALVPVALAVSPAVELEEVTNMQEVGADYWITPNVALTAQARAGGMFSYGGDGAKALVQGNIGVRIALDEHRKIAASPDKKDGVGLFVALEWRAQGLASHLSHGPAFAAGISLLNRHLKIGLLASTRPGPINGETFPTRPANGQTYKGQSSIPLRSDGGFVGLLVAPSFDIPGAEAINIEVPIALGQAAYGFYLAGEDRKTPDGRRVSAWENELFDGRDAAPTFGVEAGVKVGVRVPGARWMKPYVAGRYVVNLGYDAYVTNNYNGPSAALGLEIEN